jgi:hypothetical protein
MVNLASFVDMKEGGPRLQVGRKNGNNGTFPLADNGSEDAYSCKKPVAVRTKYNYLCTLSFVPGVLCELA